MIQLHPNVLAHRELFRHRRTRKIISLPHHRHTYSAKATRKKYPYTNIAAPPWVKFCVEFSPDEYGSIHDAGLGKFTDQWEEGAIRHRRGDYRNSYKWFVPDYPADEIYRDLHRLGFSRQNAYIESRKQVRETYDLVFHIEFVVCRVDIKFHGIQDTEYAGFTQDSRVNSNFAEEMAEELKQDLLRRHRGKIEYTYAYA